MPFKIFLVSVLLLSSVSSFAKPIISNTLRVDELPAEACPGQDAKDFCRLSHKKAVSACLSIGAHLPTTDEFAAYSISYGAKGMASIEKYETFTVEERIGYYLVDNLNPGEQTSTFYFNHSGYKAPEVGDQTEALWTASIVPANHDYAHVYYPDIGGGGGNPKDHKRDHLYAIRCAFTPR